MLRLWLVCDSSHFSKLTLPPFSPGDANVAADHTHVIATTELRPVVTAIPPQLREATPRRNSSAEERRLPSCNAGALVADANGKYP
jgi:hypothetical protein